MKLGNFGLFSGCQNIIKLYVCIDFRYFDIYW